MREHTETPKMPDGRPFEENEYDEYGGDVDGDGSVNVDVDQHLLLPLLCHHHQVLSIWLNLPVACFRHFSVSLFSILSSFTKNNSMFQPQYQIFYLIPHQEISPFINCKILQILMFFSSDFLFIFL